jgi:hypothetical protein
VQQIFYNFGIEFHFCKFVICDGLYPVEIKSGRTITQEFFKGLLFWQKITNSRSGTVIYGGEEHQSRSNGINVLPWNRAGEL